MYAGSTTIAQRFRRHRRTLCTMFIFTFLCALHIASPAVAMAADDHGVAMAWVDHGRIEVARLDAGSPHEMPFSSGKAPLEASCPSIAKSPSGSGFTLAWLEESQDDVRAIYARLDSDLTPQPPKVLTRMAAATVLSPVVVRSGASTWLTANNLVWQLRGDGSLDVPLESAVPASDMVANAPFPRLVGATKAVSIHKCSSNPSCRAVGRQFNGYCFNSPGCRIDIEAGYALKFLALYSTFDSVPFTFESDAQPAIASDGRDVLIAWFRGTQQLGGDVVIDRFSDLLTFSKVTESPQQIGSFGPEYAPVRPDVATDGERYVIVWQLRTPAYDHDIVAVALDAAGHVTRFTIASSADDERNPSVISTRPGSFLIAYEKIGGTDRQIAHQFITFDGRARVVR
jgi:hypothetical protein